MKIIKLHILLLLITVVTSVGVFATGFSVEKNITGSTLTSVADYDSLFLMGSATPAGWDIANPVPMEMDENDSLVFHWTGTLTGTVESPGEIKFPTYKGADAWCDGDWVHPVEAGQSITNSEAVILTGCADNNPDYKWNVTKDTTYTITVNLNDTTVTFSEAAPVEDSGYENLYLVGDATPGGWDLANQTAMTADPDEYAFSWTGTLTTGAFKIKTYDAEDFCAGDWIHPLEQGQDFSETDFEILEGCVEGNTDYTWEIDKDTTYTIEINLQDSTINIFQGEAGAYDNIFIVGDAAPGGWDLANQTPLEVDSTDNNIFHWSGNLTSGEFKFKTYVENDFCAGEWIHPLEQGQDLSETGFQILEGCVEGNTDYKWVIAEEDTGAYSISINLNDSTITIQKEQTSTSIEDKQLVDSFTLSQNYPNPFNPSTKIQYTLDNAQKVELTVYNVMGQKVSTLINGSKPSGVHSVSFDGSGLSSGVYYYRLTAGDLSVTKQMLLLK